MFDPVSKVSRLDKHAQTFPSRSLENEKKEERRRFYFEVYPHALVKINTRCVAMHKLYPIKQQFKSYGLRRGKIQAEVVPAVKCTHEVLRLQNMLLHG